MTDVDVPASKAGEIMEALIAKGDLARLTPEERGKYYVAVCNSMGLNPLTQPLEYVTLNGKLTLYARKNAAEQLRKTYGVSVEITSTEKIGDLYVVRAKATDRTGRVDEDMGAVPLGRLQGEALSNAMMKAITKAKRRVTLSICGLGFLDETEVESVPGARYEVPARDKMSHLTAKLQAPKGTEIVREEGVLPAWKSEAYERIDAAESAADLMKVSAWLKAEHAGAEIADKQDINEAWKLRMDELVEREAVKAAELVDEGYEIEPEESSE